MESPGHERGDFIPYPTHRVVGTIVDPNAGNLDSILLLVLGYSPAYGPGRHCFSLCRPTPIGRRLRPSSPNGSCFTG
jgi:hypothetical protein